jgi:outer membrane lipoprotein SlyB
VGLIECERANRLQPLNRQKGEENMTRLIGALALLALATITPAQQASAQNALGGAIVGGAAGALIGGAVTGRAGGAIAGGIIGGVVGATIAAQAERRNNYYWYNGRCYAAVQGGYVLVKRAYCY